MVVRNDYAKMIKGEMNQMYHFGKVCIFPREAAGLCQSLLSMLKRGNDKDKSFPGMDAKIWDSFIWAK
jgi:hypothetical protein